MVNVPGGHQQGLMPATSRCSPAFEPLKADGTTVAVGSSAGVTDSTRWQPSTPDASKTSEQSGLAKGMTISAQPQAVFHLLPPDFVRVGEPNHKVEVIVRKSISASTSGIVWAVDPTLLP